MRAVVTGATGFVGSHLVDRLKAEGVDVLCLVRPTSDRSRLEQAGVRIVQTRLEDRSAMGTAADGADVVFHVAGRIRALRTDDFRRDNVDATRQLAEACAGLARPPRLVVVSSQAAAGPATVDRPAVEANEPRPLSPYGRSKLAGERAALELGDRLGVVVVRPPTVYGPRDHALLPLFRAVRWGVAPALPHDPHVSLVHVADLVDCLWRAAVTLRARGGVYFASTEPAATFSTLVDLVALALGARPVRVPIPAPLLLAAGAASGLLARLGGTARPFDLAKAREMLREGWVCSSARARDELGWSPSVGHAEGLAETADWYRREGWL